MDLPFQWDNGDYISPFVASSEEGLASVSHWLLDNVLVPAMRRHLGRGRAGCSSSSEGVEERTRSEGGDTPTETAPLVVHMRLVDLGCGDGSALFYLSQHLAAAWCARARAAEADSGVTKGEEKDALALLLAQARLRISALGVDLDDTLIDTARERSGAFSAGPAVDASRVESRYQFVCSDIRNCDDMDGLFPAYSSPTGPLLPANEEDGDRHQAHLHTRPVLYLYLLPEALEVMKTQLQDIAGPRGWLVMSNRWPIPYLEEGEDDEGHSRAFPSTVQRVDMVSIYDCQPAGGERRTSTSEE